MIRLYQEYNMDLSRLDILLIKDDDVTQTRYSSHIPEGTSVGQALLKVAELLEDIQGGQNWRSKI